MIKWTSCCAPGMHTLTALIATSQVHKKQCHCPCRWLRLELASQWSLFQSPPLLTSGFLLPHAKAMAEAKAIIGLWQIYHHTLHFRDLPKLNCLCFIVIKELASASSWRLGMRPSIVIQKYKLFVSHSVYLKHLIAASVCVSLCLLQTAGPSGPSGLTVTHLAPSSVFVSASFCFPWAASAQATPLRAEPVLWTPTLYQVRSACSLKD